MDKIEFTKYDKFPVSTKTYNFLQSIIGLGAAVAQLGGQNYILSGCVDSGTSVSSGVVVVGGEILPFQGGVKLANIVIQESKSSVDADGTTYADIYIDRKVIFGSGAGEIAWSSLSRVTSLVDLAAQLAAHIEYHNTIGTTVFLGSMDASGKVERIKGSVNVSGSRFAGGMYELTHNIGHTNYMVLGLGNKVGAVSIKSIYNIAETSCDINLSDDDSLNDGSIRFLIIEFKS